MTTKTRTTIRSAIVCVSLLAITGAAEAARWRTCNGSSVKWRGTVNIHRNRCSIADTGLVNSAYWNGMRQWDRLSNVVDGTFVNSATDCWIGYGDGQNEVGLVNRSAIDGANGLTVLQLGLCFIGSNDIDEADVMIANDLSFTPRNGDFLGTTGRSTFVHEFGHFFGFLHEDAHDVLRTTPPHLLTGGSEPSTVWPSDTIGMNALYGFATSRPNLLPSALGVVGGAVQTLDPAGTVAACRGAARTVRVYLGNSGNVSSGTYNLRIRMNTTAPMAGYSLNTTVVAGFTHSLGAFSQGTFDLAYTIPFSLPFGVYRVYVDMDHTGSIAEILEGDNRTVSARRINVNC
jgi:hypothetical protein